MLRASGRGEAGLLGVLWSPQGQSPIESISGDVLQDIRASLGAQMAGKTGTAFEKQLQRNFEAAWQPSRKQLKKGQLHEIEEQLAKARQAAADAQSTIKNAEE